MILYLKRLAKIKFNKPEKTEMIHDYKFMAAGYLAKLSLF